MSCKTCKDKGYIYRFWSGPVISQEHCPKCTIQLTIYYYPNGRDKPCAEFTTLNSLSTDSWRRYRNSFKQELATKYAGSIFMLRRS